MKINKDECNYIDIARIIGIYLVVLGHFPYSEYSQLYKDLIYAFHMPLFFVISGILHRQTDFNIDSLKKIFISLIVPFIIYNIIFIPIAMCFPEKNYSLKRILFCSFFGDINAPTWFFIALFGVKFLSLFIKKNSYYLIICIISIILLEFLKNVPYLNLFKMRAVLAAFPFFSFGYLIKDKINSNISVFMKGLMIIVSILFVYWVCIEYGHVDLRTAYYNNIPSFYIAGILGSIATIYISQFLSMFIKNEFIKTISRGTMMIVGLHWAITDIFKLYYPNIHFFWAVLASLIIIILFYFPIKMTYNRIPILFGKTK